MKACAFTGHRKISSEDLPRIRELLALEIERAYQNGCRDFYSGGAVGFDTIAARIVLRMRLRYPDIRLILLLPCIEQGAKWSSRDRDSYDYLLAEADEVRYISEEYTNRCMKERNFALASSADLLIAFVERGQSGSAQTLRMADKMGKEVINISVFFQK